MIAALRFEIVSLLRTRETYTIFLLPAALCLPLFAAVFMFYESLSRPLTLALPVSDPAGMLIGDTLEEAYALLRSDDPAGAFERGAADIAITSWETAAVHVPFDSWYVIEPPVRPWLAAEGLWHNDNDYKRLRLWLDAALRREIDIALPDTEAIEKHRWVAVIYEDKEISTRVVLPYDYRRATVIGGVFFLLYGGLLLIPAKTTSERLSGALEAMAVTATPIIALYAARIIVCTLLLLLIGALPIGMLLLLIGGSPLASESPLASVNTLDVLEGVTAGVLFNTWFVFCGLLAASVRLSVSFASYLLMLVATVLLLALFSGVPQVPLFGMAMPGGELQLIRIALSVLWIAASLLVLASLARRERMLPPALGGE